MIRWRYIFNKQSSKRDAENLLDAMRARGFKNPVLIYPSPEKQAGLLPEGSYIEASSQEADMLKGAKVIRGLHKPLQPVQVGEKAHLCCWKEIEGWVGITTSTVLSHRGNSVETENSIYLV